METKNLVRLSSAPDFDSPPCSVGERKGWECICEIPQRNCYAAPENTQKCNECRRLWPGFYGLESEQMVINDAN